MGSLGCPVHTMECVGMEDRGLEARVGGEEQVEEDVEESLEESE